MNELEIKKKRKFWRRILISGILVIIVALVAMMKMYLSGMEEVRAGANTEIEQEVAMLSARSDLLFNAGVWTLPFAIIASVMVNVARFKLRKLKKLKNPL